MRIIPSTSPLYEDEENDMIDNKQRIKSNDGDKNLPDVPKILVDAEYQDAYGSDSIFDDEEIANTDIQCIGHYHIQFLSPATEMMDGKHRVEHGQKENNENDRKVFYAEEIDVDFLRITRAPYAFS